MSLELEAEVLFDKYKDKPIGSVIPYSEVEEILGLDHNDRRYRAITKVWRQKEQTRDRIIICRQWQEFVVTRDKSRTTSRTIPWADDEFILVNEARRAYHTDPIRGLMVEFPGGQAAIPLNLLVAHQCKVIMPKRMRLTD